MPTARLARQVADRAQVPRLLLLPLCWRWHLSDMHAFMHAVLICTSKRKVGIGKAKRCAAQSGAACLPDDARLGQRQHSCLVWEACGHQKIVLTRRDLQVSSQRCWERPFSVSGWWPQWPSRC